MGRIWDESGRHKRAKARRKSRDETASPRIDHIGRIRCLALSHSLALFAQSRDAEPATRAANDAFLKSLPFSDRADFDDARRGFVATLPDGVIAGPGGRPAFDTKPYAFLQKDEVPATVNPSLWRQAQLNAVNGLFKVTERVYQVRGLDIANMTIIEGDSAVDPDRSAAVERNREGRARSLSREPSRQSRSPP